VEQHLDKHELALNFNKKLFHLFKEQTNLKRLDFRPILSITIKSAEVQNLYPFALSLQESLRTFSYVNSKVSDKILLLIAKVKKETQNLLFEGLELTWRNETRVEAYSKKLSKKVMDFEEAVNSVIQKTETIEQILTDLSQCEIKEEKIAALLKDCQKIVDEMNFQEFSNLDQYVEQLDARVSDILRQRLEELVQNWTYEFTNSQNQPQGGNLIKVKSILEVKI